MKANPRNIAPREDVNLRQGIKSSLPQMKLLFASCFTLFKISNSSVLKYSQEVNVGGKQRIVLHEDLKESLFSFFQNQIDNSSISNSELLDKFNKAPVFTSQLEALQVALQLFWKLGEISFVSDIASSSERSGGMRYNKEIKFSTYIDIVDAIFTNENNQVLPNAINFIFNTITGASLETNNIENKLISILTVFSEEAQFKIRQNSNEIYFQQEGIYSEIVNKNTVVSSDSHEPVGPFRILKSAVKDNLNFYMEDDRTEGFRLKQGKELVDLENYLIRVNTFLNLNPKITNINIYEQDEVAKTIPYPAINSIFFGPPGTGKSYKADELTKGHFSEKVTFHPEYDYNSFVGGYKPITKDDKIQYKFVPQVFTNIYVKAWSNPDTIHFLQIEEINRGNVSAIFGDLFQLLDRDEFGYSKYEISAEEELKKYLQECLDGDGSEGIKNGKLRLPKNLNIIATMNTSDQSLFPIDSAFKRRWKWEFVPILYDMKESDFIIQLNNERKYRWLDFIKAVNSKIYEVTQSSDKQIGNFFVDAQHSENIINEDTFINKVFFYLWNDVFKDENDTIFIDIEGDKIYFEKLFEYNSEERSKILSHIIEEVVGVQLYNGMQISD